MGKAIGLEDITATMVRQSAEATIQSIEDMASRCKLLNMHSRQIVQISVIFISNKSISMTIKEWHLVSLTSNISAKICPWF